MLSDVIELRDQNIFPFFDSINLYFHHGNCQYGKQATASTLNTVGYSCECDLDTTTMKQLISYFVLNTKSLLLDPDFVGNLDTSRYLLIMSYSSSFIATLSIRGFWIDPVCFLEVRAVI